MIAATKMTPENPFLVSSMPFKVERQFVTDGHVSEPLTYAIVQIEVQFPERPPDLRSS